VLSRDSLPGRRRRLRHQQSQSEGGLGWYKESQNLELVYRSSDGRDERLPVLANELVNLGVDLILTRKTPAALAAKSATATIPVVMAASGDPVGTGIVSSLARPGGTSPD
jgi:ABC-type uncharacterized transport system substrate-binding protein